MKRLIVCILLMALTLNVHASCNWKTDIAKKDGHYRYTIECHKLVGKMVQDLKDREEQAKKFRETIKLKDLALDTADKRIMNWRKEAYNQHSILERHAKFRRYENYMWFAGGISLMVISVWATGQLK